jgi:hypothetical protein
MKTSRKSLYVIIVCILVLSSCATTITTRMVMQKYYQKLDNKEILNAITYVLVNNGFDIALMNEKYGLVNTNYRTVVSGTDTALSVVSALASAMSRGPSSYNTFGRELMISIQITEDGYKVIPKVMHVSKTTSMFSTSSNNSVEYPTKDSPEGLLVNKIRG